jgi:hypothetical protein
LRPVSSVCGLFRIPSQSLATKSSYILPGCFLEIQDIFIPRNCAQQPYPGDKNHLAPPLRLSEQARQDPLPPPYSTCSSPWQDADWDQSRWKPHFGLYFEVRGHSSDHGWTWRPFLALLLVCTRSGSRDTDPGVISARLSLQARVENRPGRYNQDTTMADRYRWFFNKRGAC